MKSLGCKEYWLTETGGLYKFGSFWSKKTMKGCSTASSCQVKATKYMFSLAKKNKKIKRLYVYTWFGARHPALRRRARGQRRRAQGAGRDPQIHVGGRRPPASRQAARWAAWSLRIAARRSIARSLPLRTILRISGTSGFSSAGTFCSANSNSMCVPPLGRS